VTGHEGGQGGGASSGDLKLSGVTLGAKEKVGGDRVENQEVGAELLQSSELSVSAGTATVPHKSWISSSKTCIDSRVERWPMPPPVKRMNMSRSTNLRQVTISSES
jgi:hypothetical protein